MPNPPRWTAQEDAELRRLLESGTAYTTIGTAMGRGIHSVRSRAHRLGMHLFRWPTAGQKARAVALLASGESVRGAARALSLSVSTVRRIRIGAGLPALNTGIASARAKRVGASPNAPTPIEALYLRMLDGGPLRVSDLMKRAGRSGHAVKSRLRDMRAKGLAFCEGLAGSRPGALWQSLSWWLENNQGVVYAQARGVAARNPHCDLEDIASVMRVTVARSVKTFRSRGWKFSTYALKGAKYDAIEFCINELRRGVRVPSQFRFDGSARLNVGSLEGLADAGGTGFDRLDCLADRRGEDAPIMAPDFWQRAVAGLDPRRALVVVAHYRDGRTYSDIGAELGVSKERVRQIIERAHDEIRKRGALAEFAA